MQVHRTAVVDDGATLAEDVRVGPQVVIEADVQVGAGTVLGPGTVLLAGSRIGANCVLGPYASIGGLPMDRDFHGERTFAVLEDGVEVRDFASVHRASGPGAETRVGQGTMIMSYAHVSHNARVGAGVVLTTTVQLGGHSEVGDHAVLGAGAMVHQYTRIGAYAMFGANSGTNKDVLPFTMARGNVARHYRLNRVGLLRHGIDGARYTSLERAIRALRRGDEAAFDELAAASVDVARLRAFRNESRRGVARFLGG